MKTASVFALTLSLAGAAQANLLTNGSFELGTFTGGSFGFPLAEQLNPGSTTMPGWQVVTQELAWFKTGQAGITTQDGLFAVDLTGFCDLGLACGATGVFGGVSQSVATVVGASYRLTFQVGTYLYNAWMPSMVASAGSTSQTFVLTPTLSASGAWEAKTLDFVASDTSTTISFGGALGAGTGRTPYLGLDNANLVLVSLPVPEPASCALMLAGLVGLGVARRRAAAVR